MRTRTLALIVPASALLVLAACAKSTPPSPAQATDPGATTATAEASLAAREAELKKREEEVASREAALAQTPSRKPAAAAADRPAVKPEPATSKPAPAAGNGSSAPAITKPALASAQKPLVVPQGTQLSLALAEAVSTKNAKVGDTIRATVVNDVRIDGKVAIASGSTVAGQVTDVVSGSNKIGGVPRLGLSFERLELPGNRDVPISGEITQRGKSDNARDTVKIVGGAAAGAILGHEVKGGDKGKVIGGLLGGAIGAVAAQKTGTEVQLAAGTELAISLTSDVEIPR